MAIQENHPTDKVRTKVAEASPRPRAPGLIFDIPYMSKAQIADMATAVPTWGHGAGTCRASWTREDWTAGLPAFPLSLAAGETAMERK